MLKKFTYYADLTLRLLYSERLDGTRLLLPNYLHAVIVRASVCILYC